MGKNSGLDLTNEEFQIVRSLIRNTHQSVFMTGKAGAGKSTFLKYITAHTKKKFVVLAPTGIAAVNAGGVTLHSFFKIPFKPLLSDDPDFVVNRLRERLKYTKKKQKLIRELELIIIDEISMVRADVIDFVDKVLRVYSGNMRDPFGGKQLLLVGDIFQLEPVVTPDMRELLRRDYPNPYFFSARAFRDLAIVPIELKKVYRQNDSDFVALLDRFRLGVPTDNDFARLNAKVGQPPANADADKFAVTLATLRDTADSINEQHLAALPSQEIVFHGEIENDFPENSLPVPLELTLKTDAQVVFVRNDREHRWVNGTVGKVYKASADKIEVELEDGTRHTVEPEIWENIQYDYDEKDKRVIEKVIGTYKQYPLRLAWAMTIHKSQGLTFTNVNLDFGRGTFAAGQAYVALSRCRSIEGISLNTTLSPRDAFVNPAIVNFSRQFNDPRLVNAALENAAADDAYQRAAEAFDEGDMRSAVDSFVKAVGINNKIDSPQARRLISLKLNKIGALERYVNELEEQLADNRRRFARLATEYISMGYDCLEEACDITAALANFDKALSLDPGNSRALNGRARALLAGDALDEAARSAAEAIANDPTKLSLYFTLDDVYRAMNDNINRLDTMLRASEKFDKEPRIHDRLADIFEAADDILSAEKHRLIASRLRKNRK